MTRSVVDVGKPTDTGPIYTITITRNALDTVTDYSTVTAVALLLPDGSTKAVTVSSALVGQWKGTVKYGGWFGASGSFPTRARVTFGDGTIITLTDSLEFNVH